MKTVLLMLLVPVALVVTYFVNNARLDNMTSNPQSAAWQPNTRQADDKYAAYVEQWHRVNDAPKYTAFDVATVFADNEVRGEQTFSGWAQIDGIISSIETRTITGGASVELIGGVTCQFDSEQVSQLSSLHRGQRAIVSGQHAIRLLGQVQFSDCQLVSFYVPQPPAQPKPAADMPSQVVPEYAPEQQN